MGVLGSSEVRMFGVCGGEGAVGVEESVVGVEFMFV